MVGHNKPAGHFVTHDANGKKIEGETRQCAHCQFTWIYRPGSGIKRRVCLKCMGLTCGRPECVPCAPFSEILDSGDKRYTMSDGGVFVKKE